MTIPGINIITGIVPTDTNDTHATHYSKYGQGGRHSYATIPERDAIPMPRRELGMQVYVASTDKTYELKNGLTNAHWVEALTTYYIDQAIENNTVVATFKRGYNNTGATIGEYKFVTLDNGFTFNYPNVKIVDSYSFPVLGLVTADVPINTGVKFPDYSLLQLPSGILDTTSIPLRTPIYCNNNGDFTLNWTPLQVGFTLSQSTTPKIYLKIFEPKEYREINLTAVTLQTIVHNLGYVPNIIIVDLLGRNITDAVNISQDENDITLESNVPITGKLIYK